MKADVLSLALLAVSANADIRVRESSETTVTTCRTVLGSITIFCKNDSTKSYKCVCQTPQGLGSWLNCAYGETSVNNTGVEKWIKSYCKEDGGVTYTTSELRAQYQNATYYIRDITTDKGYNSSAVTSVPVTYDTKTFETSYESTWAGYKNENWGIFMGAAMIGYWGFFIVIAAFYNLLDRAFFVSRHLKSHPINLFRKWVTLPALTNNRKHAQPVQYLKIIGGYIPSRVQSIVIFLYFAMVIVFSAVGYSSPSSTSTSTHGSHGSGSSSKIAGYVGDRTGILACFGFVLTFLFGGRNNFLLWVTGWKLSTFISIHKWTSIVNFLLAAVHSVAYTVQLVNSGKIGKYDAEFMRWGAVATVSSGFLIGQSVYFIRKNQYELFLLFHILLAVFFLIGTWIHVAKFTFTQSCISMASIWCFDRFVRLVRLAYFGVQKAQITVVSDEVLKMVVPRHKLWKAFPGSFGYLHYLTPTAFLQSHPFCMIDSDDKTITFITKIKGGVTSAIHRHVRDQPDQTTNISVLVEGPYGEQAPVHKFDTVLYYTGATGVPSSYAYILDCERRDVKHHVKFYWVIRNWKSLDWFYEELLELKKTQAQVIIYITDPSSDQGTKHLSSSESSSAFDKNESQDEEIKDIQPKSLDFIDFRMGRPPIEQLVESDLKEANGNVAVLTCGPGGLVDDVRYSVSQSLDCCKGRVEFFDELQVW
jgi:predicted ferric reductase